MVEESTGTLSVIPELIETDPGSSMQFAVAMAETTLKFQLVDDPQAERVETRRTARLAAQLNSALFQLAGTASGTVEPVGYESGVLDLPTTGPTSYTHLRAWLNAYWWSQITRNSVAENVLAEFRLDDLAEDGQFDDYWCRMFEALRGFDSGDHDWPGSVSAALESIDHPTMSTREESTLLALDLFGMLSAIGDQDEFSTQLERALESHRAYWSATAERRADPVGFASLPILGLTAKASYEGMRIEVESDYLPRGLLENPRWMFDLA
ncbi:hypothetical protein SCNU_02907 [Gordonia neofelifaecis NRRL B-59395]|uniref:Uncharacterized protein n=2 Tax=Gordonia TaxID=2053 RepID=F1YFH8_9ACTN|nr:hypothetical protein SCNU_02907 [Gordonia neofelifaecis NRRL B-59395]